jgi:hypothetical protein
VRKNETDAENKKTLWGFFVPVDDVLFFPYRRQTCKMTLKKKRKNKKKLGDDDWRYILIAKTATDGIMCRLRIVSYSISILSQ